MSLKTKECKHGTFTYYTNDFWIGGGLEATGEYSPQEVSKLEELLNVGSTVIEVGANIGTITVPLAKAVGSDGKVFAFEPQPKAVELLRENVRQNNLGQVAVLPYAVSNLLGATAIRRLDYTEEHINSGAASIVDVHSGSDDQDQVEMTTLDVFCGVLDDVDLIKIDVEGHELQVLQGAVDTIEKHKPILYVENDQSDKSVALIRFIMELGYVCYWHFPELYNPDPVHGGDFISMNMLCAPKDRILPAKVMIGLKKVMSENDDPSLAVQRNAEAKAVLGIVPPSPVKRKIVRGNDWACVVRLGGVGDNIIASSVFPYLKKKYGKLEVICAYPQNVVFENNPYIDKLTVKQQNEPPWEDGHAWQRHWISRAKEYAFFANLSHSCETHVALTKVQTAYYWGASVRRKLCGRNYLEAVADICEVPYDALAPGFYPDELELEQAEETKRLLGGKYISWVMSGSRVDKIWPPAAVVIARLLKETGIPIVIMGAPGRDFELAKAVQEHVRNANGSDAGLHLACSVDPNRPNWPIRRILTQSMLADLVVTPDTGPGWAVSQCDMPKVVLLSHASPENITKYWKNTTSLHADAARVPCWPCHLLIDEPGDCERLSGTVGAQGAACISDIKPDVVVKNIKQMLGAGASKVPLLDAAE